MANVVEVVFKAKDQMSKEVSGIFGNLQKQVGGVSGAFEKLTGISLANGLALGALTTGVKFVTDVMRDSVNQTVDYAKSVRDLSQNLNITTEETSRLIQTADDYGISIGSMETAMKMALKNGFAPTVESLATAADKYLAIQDPTERAAELTKIFGRNWAELTPMLKEGGAAIREAAAAQAENLIVTAESAQKAREFEIASDSLGDAVQGLKYEIGNGLLPTLISLVNWLENVVTGTSEAEKALESETSALTYSTDSYDEYVNAIIDAYAETYNLDAQTQKAAKNRIKEGRGVSELAQDYGGLRESEWRGLKQAKELGDYLDGPLRGAMAQAGRAAQEMAAQEEFARQAAEALKLEQQLLGQELADLQLAVSGPIREEQENFTEAQAANRLEAEKLRAEIKGLIDEGYDPAGKEVGELNGKLGELDTAFAENAAAHELATKKIVFNLLTQRAALDGLTQDENTLLTTVALNWGLIDQETADATIAIDQSLTALANGVGMSTVVSQMGTLLYDAETLNGMDVKFKVTTTYVAVGTPGYTGGGYAGTSGTYVEPEQMAAGGPVHPGQTYLVGEAGPELLQMGATGGMVTPITNNNYNLTINSRANTENMAADFLLMQALAGG